jgi:hypothetical protein
MTCRRRLRDRHEARVGDRLHEELPAEAHAASHLDWHGTPPAVSVTGGNRNDVTQHREPERWEPTPGLRLRQCQSCSTGQEVLVPSVVE